MKARKGQTLGALLMTLFVMSIYCVPAVSADAIRQSDPVDIQEIYSADDYTVRLVDSNLSWDLISEETEKTEKSFEKKCMQYLPPRYIGAADIEIADDEKVVAYVFRVLPNGESASYTEVVPADNDSISMEEVSSRVDAWIDGPLKSKTDTVLQKNAYELLSSEADPIHTATISRTYTGIGRAELTTTWYWDDQENNNEQDYFFTKTAFKTDPGVDLSGYEPYLNYHFNVEIDSDYSLGSYQHLPEVHVIQSEPPTTTGYTTVGITLGGGSCTLGWSTDIPDNRVVLHHPSGNTFNWDEEFSWWASCASSSFRFLPGQSSYCPQSSARNGNTYIISRVVADVSSGWVKIDDGISYFGPTGTNYWGHICKTRWSNGYIHA